MSAVAIKVENLSKRYRLGTQERYKTFRDTLTTALAAPFRRPNASARRVDRHIWALSGVSFEISRGDVVGIIGRNGAGKTTLLKILSRITSPTTGYAEIHGRVGSLLEVGTGFHNELTGRENIYLSGAILGMRKTDLDRKFDEIVAFAEVAKFIDTPTKHYSTGMYLRLAFAVAAHLQRETLLVDEVLAVGDAAFQQKCLGKMGDVAREGRTVLFVSHNMGAVRALCNKGILLDRGRLIVSGNLSDTIESYYKLIGVLRRDTHQDDEGHSRFGSLSLNGSHGNTVGQSHEFEISTTLRIDQAVSGFNLYCTLEDMQGRWICGLRETSTALGLAAVGVGKYIISAVFPPLWLTPGLYSIYFKVLLWGEYGSARHVSDKFPLDVVGVSSPYDVSILHPRVKWSIQPDNWAGGEVQGTQDAGEGRHRPTETLGGAVRTPR